MFQLVWFTVIYHVAIHTTSPSTVFQSSFDGYICENLFESIKIIYYESLQHCSSYCGEQDWSECRVTNYISSVKSNSDSRCYIFSKPCTLYSLQNDAYLNTNQSTVYLQSIHQNIPRTDYPTDWRDNNAQTCTSYVSFDACSTETLNASFDVFSKQHFIDYRDTNAYNLSALDVCYHCGGGIMEFDGVQFYNTLNLNHDRCTIHAAYLSDVYTYRHPDTLVFDIQFREWDSIILYQLCNHLRTFLDCNIFIFAAREAIQSYDNIYWCHFDLESMELYNNTSDNDYVYFIVTQKRFGSKVDLYLNAHFFSKLKFYVSFTIVQRSYKECLMDIYDDTHVNISYSIIHLCSFVTTHMHTTTAPTAMPTSDPVQPIIITTTDIITTTNVTGIANWNEALTSTVDVDLDMDAMNVSQCTANKNISTCFYSGSSSDMKYCCSYVTGLDTLNVTEKVITMAELHEDITTVRSINLMALIFDTLFSFMSIVIVIWKSGDLKNATRMAVFGTSIDVILTFLSVGIISSRNLLHITGLILDHHCYALEAHDEVINLEGQFETIVILDSVEGSMDILGLILLMIGFGGKWLTTDETTQKTMRNVFQIVHLIIFVLLDTILIYVNFFQFVDPTYSTFVSIYNDPLLLCYNVN
eukprot:227971_1